MRLLFALLMLVAVLVLPSRAAEPPTVEVADMDPPAGVKVPRSAALFVHLRYRSDAPLRAQAKGYFRGVEVKDGASWNPSPASPAGAGEAIAWISYSKPTLLDEIRVEVSDAHWQPLLILK